MKRSLPGFHCTSAISMVLSVVFFASTAHAATLVWTSGGATNNISEALNWNPQQIPTINDELNQPRN